MVSALSVKGWRVALAIAQRTTWSLRQCTLKGWRVALAIARWATWSLRLCTKVVAPLYRPLKWLLSAVLMAGVFALSIEFLGRIIFGEPFNINSRLAAEINAFLVGYPLAIGLSAGFAGLLFIGSGFGHSRKQKQLRLGAAFQLCMPAEDLKLADLGFREVHPLANQFEQTHTAERPFFGRYFPRTAVEEPDPTEQDAAMGHEYAEEDLERLVRNNQAFLLVGYPYSGKTLTLFNIMRRLRGYVVVTPDSARPVPDEDLFALLKGKKAVILLDNLATYAERNYDLGFFAMRLSNATGGCYGVAGTCREGGDFTTVVASSGNHVTYFFENILLKLRLSPMTGAQLGELASSTGEDVDPQDLHLYPHPGNITMRDRTRRMRDRFQSLPEQGKDLLRTMKLLDAGGIPVTLSRLHSAFTCAFHRNVEPGALEDELTALWEQFFLLEQPSDQKVNPHFGHLAYAVSYSGGAEPEDEYWDALPQALEQIEDTDALVYLADGHGRRGDLRRALGASDRALGLSPDNPEARRSRAITLSRMGRSEEALTDFSLALEFGPDNPKTHRTRGITLSRMTRFEEALADFARALELSPDYFKAHLNRGITLSRMDRFKEALTDFALVIERSPDNFEAYRNRGITLAHMDRYEEALSDFARASEISPENPMANLSRGMTLAHMDRYEEALAEFDRAAELKPDNPEVHLNRGMTLARLDRYEETLAEFDRAAELKPDNPEVHLNRGMTLSHMDRYDEALAEFDHAGELKPDNPEVYLNRGMTLARLDRYEEALAEFDRAAELKPDNPEVHLNRGMTLARLDRYEEALAESESAAELRPDNPVVHYQRGRIFALLGRFDEALRACDRAIELNPGYAQAHYDRGSALANLGRQDEAIQSVDVALELRPDNPVAHYQRGRIFAFLGRFDEALRSFDRAIELNPDYAQAHCDRGSALANLGRQDEAIQSVDVALALRPESAENYFARGFVLTTIRGFERERLKQALQAYDEAVRLRPAFPEAHRERGFILGQFGRDEEALAAFERALEFYPDYAEALFGKARTLCFLVRNQQRFRAQETFEEVMVLLELAVAIDNRTIARITRERNAFRELRGDIAFGPRLRTLVWGHPEDPANPGKSPAPSQTT